MIQGEWMKEDGTNLEIDEVSGKWKMKSRKKVGRHAPDADWDDDVETETTGNVEVIGETPREEVIMKLISTKSIETVTDGY